MLLLAQEMEIFSFYGVFERIIELKQRCHQYFRAKSPKEFMDWPRELLINCMPKSELSKVVQIFQLYITIVIMEKIFKQDVMQQVIEVMDIFYQANYRKPKDDKLADSDFYNDALNNDVDLSKQASIFYQEWNSAKKHHRDFDRHSFFTLYNYPWTLNAYRKAELFRIIQSHNRHQNIGDALLQNLGSLLDPNASNNQTINSILGAAHFTIKIRRDRILEDSLGCLVREGIGSDLRQKPLRVIFENEPAIDEGGVKKEFFLLLFKELFNPDWAMFFYNPDNRLYWFNGKTFESPLNFELIGTLMALAPQNQVILDIPILSTCYKILLDQKLDIEDLKMWQPDVYKSFQYIMNYEEEAPLEDILARTFTIDYEFLGEKITETLKKDGDQVFVTKENRQEFIDLYIEHLFFIQCEK